MTPTTRRGFLGAGAAVAVSGLAGGASLLGQGRGQGRGRKDGPKLKTFKAQVRPLVIRLRKGDATAAPVLSALIVAAAADLEESGLDARLQAAAKKYGRYPAVPLDHGEMEQLGEELGAKEAGISLHTEPDPKYDGLAYESLVRGEGLAATLRKAAADLEAAAAKWPKDAVQVLARREAGGGFGVARAQLQNGGDQCLVCQVADGMAEWVKYICYLATVLAAAGQPEFMAACITIMGEYLALRSACAISYVFGC